MTAGLQPWLKPYADWLVSYGAQRGMAPRVTSTYRSWETQRRLYASWRAGQSEFPAAPPGRSWHQYGRAFDMVTSPMSRLSELGDVWRRMGGRWYPSDPIHFEV
jgi:hypothetical protein